MFTVGLVSCVKQKRLSRCKAKDLYISPLFKKAKRYAERKYDHWFILSARYYLLNPEVEVDPYEATLNDRSIQERQNWAIHVFHQIEVLYPGPKVLKLFFHAGEDYRKYLIPLLEKGGYSCATPLRGLTIGRQLEWYDRMMRQGD